MKPCDCQLKLGWNWVVQEDIDSKALNLQHNNWKKKKESRCCNGWVKAQTSSWWNAVAGKLSINKRNATATLNEIKQHCKKKKGNKSGPKFLHNVSNCQSYRNWLLQLILAKGGFTSYWIIGYTWFSPHTASVVWLRLKMIYYVMCRSYEVVLNNFKTCWHKMGFSLICAD